MARIHLKQIGHSYGGGLYALEKADLVFEEGRTYALLGPSGCGKTTMLNIISGLVRPSDGRVLVDGADMTDVPTVRRNIAQVFQFPVVYRTKTVFENLAFPLRCRGWNTKRLRPRVEEIANLLGMSERLGQSARNLTADEKQLVSLGRGLVREDVAALLMDEPLTVIDPQMKSDLRRRIKQANVRTRNTVIYVTHDQNEAMTFADEVLVMRAGSVIQRGNAQELFESPCDTYVGTFIGSPGMNFLAAEQIGNGIGLAGVALLPTAGRVSDLANLQIGIRPEHLAFANDEEPGIPASVNFVQDQGSFLVVDLTVAGQTIKVKVRRETKIPFGPARVIFPAERLRLYADGALLMP
jgi:glycerol transport system ATP-binding protein